MYLHCVLTLLALFGIPVSECLQCFNCTNINDPDDPQCKVECSDNQSCFVQTVHICNEVLYNMGCQNNQLCSSFRVDPSGIIGRSVQTRQPNRCHECCSTDYCNEERLCAHREVHGNWSDWSTWSNCSVENVASGKHATQTDTAAGSSATFAIDGDMTTCSITNSTAAELVVDLGDNYLIEEVSIHAESISQWVTYTFDRYGIQTSVYGPPDSSYWSGSSLRVFFKEAVYLSTFEIYESTRDRVGSIACYMRYCNSNKSWAYLFERTSSTPPMTSGIFSPTILTDSCFFDECEVTSVSNAIMSIDAIKVYGRAGDMSYKLETKGVYKAEHIMNTSSSIPAKWSPAVKVPYRYIRVRANPQDDELVVCELKVKGYPWTPRKNMLIRMLSGPEQKQGLN